MIFNKTALLALIVFSAIISCKNSTVKAKTEKAGTDHIDTASRQGKQVDSGAFHKSLSFQKFNFDISTTGEGSIQQLFIQPYGLTIDSTKITKQIEGRATNAEIEDLDSDGFPEIVIYITSAGSGSYGSVIGYSVNNGKSLSQIYFPPVADNQKANKGYMGHDEFAIVDKVLTQRFKTYNAGDVNSNAIGSIREIWYKLVNGESSKRFAVDTVRDTK